MVPRESVGFLMTLGTPPLCLGGPQGKKQVWVGWGAEFEELCWVDMLDLADWEAGRAAETQSPVGSGSPGCRDFQDYPPHPALPLLQPQAPFPPPTL